MTAGSIAVFATTEYGHFQRLRPVIAGLTGRGLDVHVLADERFREAATALGAGFTGLFADRPLDDTSTPFPCRYVTWAAGHLDWTIERLRDLGALLVIYDSFAVAAPIAARAAGIPYAGARAGHAMHPSVSIPAMENDPRVSLSADCRRAVKDLRTEHGVIDASPFSYLAGVSPHLNLVSEPREFLTGAERRAFEPVAFFGSLPPAGELDRAPGACPFPPGDGPRIYVSLGTVIWRYFTQRALDLIASLAGARRRLLVSLGGADVALRDLPGARVRRWVDQHNALAHADAFVTHHGLNSTHEAILHEVPMISCPFFADQPALAARCQERSLAVALDGDIDGALADLSEREVEMRAALRAARGHELATVAARESVLDRLLSLSSGSPASID